MKPILGQAAALPLAACLSMLSSLLLFVPGCERSPSGDSQENGSLPIADQPEECEHRLQTILDVLRPERMGLSFSGDTTLSVLNDWRQRCAAPVPEEIRRSVPEQLDTPLRERLLNEEFTQDDAEHIRMAFAARSIIQSMSADTTSELERLVKLFDFVIRSVQVVDEAEAVAQSPFEILLYGAGTPRGRAWVFANLLRQQELHAVILRPAGGDQDEWLLGVPVDADLFLFDMRAGLPLPDEAAGTSGPLIRQPLTLAQLQSQENPPDLFGFGIDPSEYREPEVLLIGSPSLFSPRLWALQEVLAGDRAARIFHPLLETPEDAGLLSRTQAAENLWQPEQVSLWTWPAERLDRKLTAEQRERRELIEDTLQMPADVIDIEIVGGKPKPRFGGVEQLLRKARIAYLTGDYQQAQSDFLAVRNQTQLAPTVRVAPAIRELNHRAASWATFWSGLCLYEQGNYSAARGNFDNYLKREPTGYWQSQAERMRVISLAQQGSLKAALDEAKKLDEKTLRGTGLPILIHRWQTGNERSVPEKEAAPESAETEPSLP